MGVWGVWQAVWGRRGRRQIEDLKKFESIYIGSNRDMKSSSKALEIEGRQAHDK